MKVKIIALIFSAAIFLALLLPPILPLEQADAAGTLSVTSAYWQVGGSTVTTAHIGDTVTAKAVMTAQGGSVSGTYKIEVIKDISWSPDQQMAQATGTVNLESGSSQTISVSWSPDAVSGQNSVDGYFIVVWYNSTKIYTMSSRLSVTTPVTPTPTRTATPTSSVKVGTSLTLSISSLTPAQGQQITFSGYLKRNDTGAGVSGATISIYDSDPLADDFMASGTTGSNGFFSISWTAAPMDPDSGDVEAYAKFAGTSTLSSSQSTYYTVSVGSKVGTSLTLSVSSLTPAQGQQITFSGYLKRNDTGAGVSGATISIYDYDPFIGGDFLASGTTASNGHFSIPWTAEPKDTGNRVVEAYAKFAGTSALKSCETDYYEVTVGQKTVTTAPIYTPKPTATPDTAWRDHIRSGDIVLDPTGAYYLGHVGICYGTDYVVEALSSGVALTPIEQWDKKGRVIVLRVLDCPNDIANAAANLAYTQVGKVYQPFYLYEFKSYDLNSKMWYCSELVWAVYKHQNIDVEFTPDFHAVSPMEIYLSFNTQIIATHGNPIEDTGFLGLTAVLALSPVSWAALCPVDLVVTDPDGLTISRDSSEIPDAWYMIDDFNNDGSPDTWVSIAEGKKGTYNVIPVKQAEAQINDTYTLQSYQKTGMTTLAENVSVVDIPSHPYSIDYIPASSGLGAGAWAGIGIGIVLALVIGGYFLLGLIFGWKTEDTVKK